MVAHHFELILGHLTIRKCVFVEVDKAIFQWPRWHIQPIFGLWTRPKCYLHEAIFLVDARHCELIFCLFTSPKCDLDEVENAMIQVVEWHSEVIFCICICTNRKYDFFQVYKATIQDV